MRIRILLAATLVLALALMSGGAALAGQKGPERHRGPDKAQRFTLFAEETAATFVTATGEVFTANGDEDVPFAPSAGDRFVIVETLYYDEARTELAGRNDLECTVTQAFGEFPDEEPGEGEELPEFFVRFVCQGIVLLDGRGDLAWQGAFQFSSEDFADFDPAAPFLVVAITGGTGEFTRAGGEVAIFEFEEAGEDAPPLSRYEVTLLTFKTAKR